MFYNRRKAVAKNQVCEIRETAQHCNGSHQSHRAETLIPMRVVELAMMLVLHRAKQQFADHAKDIHRRYHNRSSRNNREGVAEKISIAKHGIVDCRILKRAEEYRHFGNESAQTRKTERSQTGNDVSHRQERHNLIPIKAKNNAVIKPWDNICNTAPLIAV